MDDEHDIVELSDDLDDDNDTLHAMILQKSGAGVDDAYQYLDWENPDHKKYMQTINHLENTAAAVESTLPRVARIVADGVLNDQAVRHIAERAQTNPAAVRRWQAEPKVKKVVELMRRARRLINAPPLAHRVQLAWRIAVRNEIINPKVSLSAIDLINKTMQVYTPEEKGNTAPVIVLGNFTVNNNGHLSHNPPPIDGEAHDVTVDAIEIDIE